VELGHTDLCTAVLIVARFVLVQTYQNRKNIPNDQRLYQLAINYTKWPQNIPNGHKIYEHFPFQGPPKFTQIGILGMKINHLATLLDFVLQMLLEDFLVGNFTTCKNRFAAFCETGPDKN
jgi:hypothetical protein